MAGAVDAAGTHASVAATTGDLYVFDVSDPVRRRLLRQVVLPGMARSVAATADFLYVGDSASTVDVIALTP